MVFGGAPVWVFPIAVTTAALIALPEIVDLARHRRSLTLGISVACIAATWFLRPALPPTQQHLFTVWLVVWLAVVGLLFGRLSIAYIHRGDRESAPVFDADFDRLLPLLEAEVGRHLSGRGVPQRHYLDSVLRLIRDHRKEGAYPMLMNALQDLAVAYGRVEADQAIPPRGRLAPMFASSYYNEAHAAHAAVKATISDRAVPR